MEFEGEDGFSNNKFVLVGVGTNNCAFVISL